MRMRWHDLLFAHWPVDRELIGQRVPPGLEIDTFEGRAWLGIVPFRMTDVGFRGLPSFRGMKAFGEINVRTYVRHEGKPGVWFLSLDAADHSAVQGARRFFRLPYYDASIASDDVNGWVRYQAERHDPRGPEARFLARYRPTGPPAPAEPGSLDAFLTERMCLYAVDGRGRIERTDIAHAPWPLQPAEAHVEIDTMAESHGLVLPEVAPRFLFSRRLDVVAWWPRRVGTRSIEHR